MRVSLTHFARRAGVGACALALAAVVGAPPADSHPGQLGGGFSTPSSAGQSFTTPMTSIGGSFHHDGCPYMDRVDGLAVRALPSGAQVASAPEVDPGDNPDDGAGGGGNASTIAFDWNPNIKTNGWYETSATGRTNQAEISVNPRRTCAANNQHVRSITRRFRVAIPPQPVRDFTATYVEDAEHEIRGVLLEWTPNTQCDLLGYEITRIVEGEAPDEPSFEDAETTCGEPADTITVLDSDVPDDGATYLYTITAVSTVPGESSPEDEWVEVSSAAGPATDTADEDDEIVVPPLADDDGGDGDGNGDGNGDGDGNGGGSSTVSPGPPPSVDLSGFTGLQPRRPTTTARPRPPSPPPSVDTGFEEALPFSSGDSDGGDSDVDGSLNTALSREVQAEVVTDRVASLAPIAAGLILLIGALQVRSLSRFARAHAERGSAGAGPDDRPGPVDRRDLP